MRWCNGLVFAGWRELEPLPCVGGAALSPGAFVFSKPAKAILVRCGDGFLAVTKLQSEGGKPVDAAAFWNGIKDRSDCRFVAGG
ncbi:MAG: hypothetical protein EBU49_13555 [Proteobacteria bacterium]|nr:hypothetical protein [Pseudomonadota bacterium]